MESLGIYGGMSWGRLQGRHHEVGRTWKRGGADFIVLATNTLSKGMGRFALDPWTINDPPLPY